MSNYQSVIRAEDRDRFKFLREMRQLLQQYYDAISQLIDLYSSVSCTINGKSFYSWQVPLSTYANFRDALFHYSVACKHEEVIMLITESSLLEEHLHRAVKDAAVFFLQQLGNKLESLRNCSQRVDTTARSNSAQGDTENIKERFYTLYERDKYADVVDLLHDSYANILWSNKSILQHWMHEIRNYDLSTRNSSMQIQKPFHPNSLNEFLDTIEQCNETLRSNHLFELVYWYADFMVIEVV